MKIIANVNHKGGVGKTTTALNTGAGMALRGKRVLLVDADPQANLSESLGVFDSERDIYNAFSDRKGLPIVRVKANLDLVPSSLRFAKIEHEMASEMARETILKGLLASVSDRYDYCIVDCPPSLGLITLNALVAAQAVYIPLEAEFLAYRGIDSIVGIIDKVKQYFNPSLSIEGVILTKYNSRKVLSQDITEKVSEYFGDKLMRTPIRVNVSLSEAQANGIDIFEYARNSNGAEDYALLVDEMLKK